MEQKITKKIISGFITGCLVLSFSALALANNDQKTPTEPLCNAVTDFSKPAPIDIERHISNCLNKLVQDGTISSVQAEKVQFFLKQKNIQRKADMELMKDMSPTERDAYMQQKFAIHQDPIIEVISAADLSDDHSKAVINAIRPPQGPGPLCR